jgi:type VI secretion system Hcp family effector
MRTLSLSVFLLIWAGQGQVLAQRVFLESAEIRGCATDRGFEEHHRVLEFDSQVYVPFDQDGRLVGNRVHQPIHFLTTPDCAASMWSRWIAEGRLLERPVFRFTTVDRAGIEVVFFFEIELGRARVVSRFDQWDFNATQSSELPQGLRLSLTFEEICWRFVDGSIQECDTWTEPRLSVSIIYFDAIPDGADVHLRWGVPSLETVSGYEVLHRSPDTNDFRSLVYLDAIHNNGVTEY